MGEFTTILLRFFVLLTENDGAGTGHQPVLCIRCCGAVGCVPGAYQSETCSEMCIFHKRTTVSLQLQCEENVA